MARKEGLRRTRFGIKKTSPEIVEQRNARRVQSNEALLNNVIAKLPEPALGEEQAWFLIEPFFNPSFVDGWPQRYRHQKLTDLIRDYHREQFYRLHKPDPEVVTSLEVQMGKYDDTHYTQARPALRFLRSIYDSAVTLNSTDRGRR